jgi:UDP:flavonoid glycosyltransferase YjiC (YdhE family)
MPSDLRLAVFISSHGFGHAARAAAVISALAEKHHAIHFNIYTKVPQWFFAESLQASYTYHPLLTDIGVVQETPMQEDLPATVGALDSFLPFNEAFVRTKAEELAALGSQMVLCDIAPLGIAIAHAAGLTSVLVENFTWDWIYDGYTQKEPGFNRHIPYLQAAFTSADYHIQASPVCAPTADADLTTAPIGRKPLTSPEEMRARLGVPHGARLVLVTMGGIPERFQNLDRVSGSEDIFLVIPGGSETIAVRDHLVLLPHHSNFYHPDLIHASDAVVGKAGYSTLSEAYHAAVPFAYVARPSFRESGPLTAFIDREMNGFEIPLAEYHSGQWVERLPALLELPRPARNGINGADQAAAFIMKQLRA